MTNEELRQRVDDMTVWARSRLRHCGDVMGGRVEGSGGVFAAEVEHRALTAVLEQLGKAVPPR